MNEETQQFTKEPHVAKTPSGSSFYNISIRGWLALMLTLTVCLMSGFRIVVEEPLYSIATFAIGFYFGQKVPSKA